MPAVLYTVQVNSITGGRFDMNYDIRKQISEQLEQCQDLDLLDLILKLLIKSSY